MSTPSKRRKIAAPSGASPLLQFLKKTTTNATNSEPDSDTETIIISTPPSSPQTPKKHRQSGIDPAWKKTFPWVLYTDDGQGIIFNRNL